MSQNEIIASIIEQYDLSGGDYSHQDILEGLEKGMNINVFVDIYVLSEMFGEETLEVDSEKGLSTVKYSVITKKGSLFFETDFGNNIRGWELKNSWFLGKEEGKIKSKNKILQLILEHNSDFEDTLSLKEE